MKDSSHHLISHFLCFFLFFGFRPFLHSINSDGTGFFYCHNCSNCLGCLTELPCLYYIRNRSCLQKLRFSFVVVVYFSVFLKFSWAFFFASSFYQTIDSVGLNVSLACRNGCDI